MEQPLLTKPVKSALLSMAAPAAFGMLMTFLFQLVDSYFVGKLGTQPLAAISFAYPVYILVVGLFMGIAAGVSATVGKALGENNKRKAQSLGTISIVLFALFTLLLGGLGYSTIDVTFSLLGADAQTAALVGEYMGPLYLGMALLVIGLIANAALMAKGVMVKTTIIMAIGGVTNVVFDYFLIFGFGIFPELGLQGAAIATLISWAVIAVLMLVLLFEQDILSFQAVHDVKAQVEEILRISTPAIAAQILGPIAIAFVTRMVSSHGESAIAAFGIATRLESLLLTGILSLSVIVTPLVAQNFGARATHRLDAIVAYSGRMTVYWGLATFGLIALFSREIMGLFTHEPQVVEHGALYFYVVGITFPAYGLVLLTSAFLNGVQQASSSLKLTLVKSLMLTIPLVFIGAQLDIEFIWGGIAIANVLGMMYAKKLLDSWVKQSESQLDQQSPIEDYWSDLKGLFSRT
ncbi:MATE family efflux transporter [Vibrio sp. SCSIO 43135]|uniref:MATE family efflux transporter n=1 Tax=Vibrio sp. SCSIO 43135 TaxID=2819096 RepID=UPI0020763330|nr:MATE family efflux transporter [Vibrio sp. SCSIO 43135]USD42732.1 MATE family efflux transporter [Vibrio sp. SCSIO 43135]